ncbi:MAG: amino acid transporter permease [Marmoricola sp.]|nr:amino acid transporter permease [Marmoricola sp.]
MTTDTWTPSPRELERQAVRRSQRRRSLLVAAGITVLVLGSLVLVTVTSAGWTEFKATFLSGHDAKEALPDITRGFWINVKMFMIAEPIILAVGILVAVTRNTVTPWLTPARIVAVIYTDLFRGLPTLLVVLVIGFGVPALRLTGVPTNVTVLGTFGLVLCYGAYVAEVIRAGIDSIHPSQVASAEALGLSRVQTTRYVVLPQAIRRVMPPLLNDFVSLQKDTCLIAGLGVFEALFVAQDYGNYNFNYTPYLVTGVFFVALTIPLARFTDWLGRRALLRERGR